MIRPNPSPRRAPMLAPGMGIMANRQGVGYTAHMGYTPGATLGSLGQVAAVGNVSASTMAAAEAAGYQAADLIALANAGASDQDIQDLVAGNDTLASLEDAYGVLPTALVSTGSATGAPTVPASAAATSTPSASAGQLPTGSQISYTAAWSPIHGEASDVQAALSSQLPQHGMQLLNFNNTGSSLLGVGTQGFTATIAITGAGFALLTDAQSILVTIVQSIIGVGNETTNQISIIETPQTAISGSQTAAPGSAQSLTTWFENNAAYIGLGIIALVALQTFFGGKRR